MVCIFLLKGFESQFQYVQKLLVLESNNLLSPHTIQAEKEMSSLWRKFASPKEVFWIFGSLKRDTEQEIIAFYATDYKQVTFPLKLGRAFSKKDSGEAIVGLEIQTYKRNNKEYFDYGNVRYPVIGKLGITEDSPLKNTVLLNNSALLNQPDIPLIFDGPHISELHWLKGHPLENKGVERWFDITFLSDWVRYMTWLVILCASVLAIHYYLVITKEDRETCMEIGVSKRTILRRDLCRIAVVSFFISAVVIWATMNHELFFEFVASSVIIYIIFSTAYLFLFWRNVGEVKPHNVSQR